MLSRSKDVVPSRACTTADSPKLCERLREIVRDSKIVKSGRRLSNVEDAGHECK